MAHQANYLNVQKLIYFPRTVFTWSSFLWKSKEDSCRLKYITSFFALSKTINTQTVKSIAATKNLFSSVYVISTTCFDKYFLIPCGNWKTLFLIKDDRYPEDLLNCHVLVFFETSNLKEYVFYFYLHNTDAKVKVQCKHQKF